MFKLAKAEDLLREILASDNLTPYVESRLNQIDLDGIRDEAYWDGYASGETDAECYEDHCYGHE
jgi:hypothetical protein